MAVVLLSLGSNLGNSKDILLSAFDDIQSLSCVTGLKKSSLFATKPVGYLDQDDFVNAACILQTTASAINFLKLMQELEQKYKRIRLFKDGPRTLDIDIIDFNHENIDSEELTLPHPRMQERAFVLAPLKEIVPDYLVNKFNKTISQLYEQLPLEEKQGAKVING